MKKLSLVIYNLLRIYMLLGCNKPNCSENVPKVIVFLGNGDFYICILSSSQGHTVLQPHYFAAHSMCLYWVLVAKVNIPGSMYLNQRDFLPKECFSRGLDPGFYQCGGHTLKIS